VADLTRAGFMPYKSMWYVISETFIKHDTANSGVSGRPDASRLHAVQVNVAHDLTDIHQTRHSKQQREWQT